MKPVTAQPKYITYWLARSLSSDRLSKIVASVQNTQVGLIRHPINIFYIILEKRIENLECWTNILRLDFENCLNLYKTTEDVDEKKKLFAKVEAMLAQKIEQTKLVTFHWSI